MENADGGHTLTAVSGALVGAVTSAGILLERLTEGSALVAVAGDIATTLVAMLVWRRVAKAAPSDKSVLWSAVGALASILTIHAVLPVLHLAPWLAEGPRQMVNDMVASAGIVSIIFVLRAPRVCVPCLAVVAAVVSTYALSHDLWHLDRAPHGFATTVQQCVVAQFISVALALALFRALRRPLA